MSIKDKIKSYTKTSLGSELIGQGLGAGARGLISTVTTDLGAKVFSTVIGGLTVILNEKTRKSSLVRKAGVHMLYGFTDPTARQVTAMKRNWNDVLEGARMHSFKSAFGGLIEEPEEIRAAWRDAMPRLGGAFSKVSGKFKGARKSYRANTIIRRPDQVESESIARAYARKDPDIVQY